MLKEGTWWLKSESDPRWNCSGRDNVGMFMTVEACPPALLELKKKTKELGIAPKDLEFGYMKD